MSKKQTAHPCSGGPGPVLFSIFFRMCFVTGDRNKWEIKNTHKTHRMREITSKKRCMPCRVLIYIKAFTVTRQQKQKIRN